MHENTDFFRLFKLGSYCLLVWLISNNFVCGQPQFEVLVEAGETVPDGDGTILNLNVPVINNSGTVAFRTRLIDTSGGTGDDECVCMVKAMILTVPVREGDPAPDGNGQFGNLQSAQLQINDAGQVVFLHSFENSTGGFDDDRAIALADCDQAGILAREGDLIRGSNDRLESIAPFAPDFNNTGQVAFDSSITGGQLLNVGVFVADQSGLTKIARTDDPVPDSNETILNAFGITINDKGVAAFNADLSSSTANPVYSSAGGPLTEIIRRDVPAPDGNGLFSTFSNVAIVDSGDIFFNGFLSQTTGGSADSSGLFRTDGSKILQIVRRGQVAPDGNGVIDQFSMATTDAWFNNQGQAVFRASVDDTLGGSTDNEGIFFYDGQQLIQIARKGGMSPDKTFEFQFLDRPVINERGQIAFRHSFLPAAIFFYDPHSGLQQVIREGDPFFGANISMLDMQVTSSGRSNGLNDIGQIAFSFTTSGVDGSRGIAVWSSSSIPGDVNQDGSVDLLERLSLHRSAGGGRVPDGSRYQWRRDR